MQTKLSEQSSKTSSELDSTRLKLTEVQQELGITQDSLLQERGKVLQLETKLSKTEKQLNTFKQSAANDSVKHQKEITDLKAVIESLSSQHNQRAAELDASKIESLNSQIQQMLEEKNILSVELIQYREMNKELNQLRVEHTQLSEENLSKTNEIKHLNYQLSQAIEKAEQLSANEQLKASLEQDKSCLQEQIASMSTNLTNVNENNKVLENRVQQLTNEVQTTAKLKCDLENELSTLLASKIEWDNIKSQYEESIDSLNEKLTKYTQQDLAINDLNVQMSSVQELNEKHTLEINQLQTLLKLKSEEYDKEHKIKEDLSIKLSLLSEELQINVQAHDNLLQERDVLQSNHNQLVELNSIQLENLTNLEKQISVLNSQLAAIQNAECISCLEWKKQVALLKATNETTMQRLEDHSTTMNQQSLENKRLLDDISEKQRCFKESEAETQALLETQKQEILSLQKTHHLTLEEIKNIKSELAQKENEKKELVEQASMAEKRIELLQIEVHKREEDMKENKQKITESIDKYFKESELTKELAHTLSTRDLDLKLAQDDLTALEAVLENEKQSNLKLLEKIKDDRQCIAQLKEQQHKLTKLCEESQNSMEELQNKFQEDKRNLLKELEALKEQFNKERSNFTQSFKQMQQDKITTELATIESLKNQIIELKNVYTIQLQLVDTREQ